jgi:hypothetical protein
VFSQAYLENHAAELGSKKKLLALSDQGIDSKMLLHV